MGIMEAWWRDRSDLTIREPAVIYEGVVLGHGVQTGHYVMIRESAVIGDASSVGSFTEIGHHCVIGRDVRIHSHCFVAEYTRIEDGVWLGPGVMVANVWHPLCSLAKECIKCCGCVIIEPDVIVGMGAIIGPGVRLNRGAFVGAGALVLDDVGAGEVVVGSPAHYLCLREELLCKSGLKDRPYEHLFKQTWLE